MTRREAGRRTRRKKPGRGLRDGCAWHHRPNVFEPSRRITLQGRLAPPLRRPLRQRLLDNPIIQMIGSAPTGMPATHWGKGLAKFLVSYILR